MRQDESYDVTAVIDAARVSPYQWMVLAIALATAMFDGYDTQGIAYVAPVMAKQLGISPAQLGPVFSAGLLGLTLGGITFGMLADKIGRRQAIIWPVVVFGVFSILTPMAHTLQGVIVLRLLAGFGLGGTLPSVTAYVLEYSPHRMRALLVNSTGAFFAFGSIVGGVLANALIPTWGWQSTFYVGGIVPLLFLGIVIPFLPESVRFLLLSGKAMERVASIMQKMVPDRKFASSARFALEPRLAGITVKHLFTEGRALGTVLIWIAFIMNLFVLVYIIFWMPTLLREVGQPLDVAIRATIFYSIGGIVGGLDGRLDRRPRRLALWRARVRLCGRRGLHHDRVPFHAGHHDPDPGAVHDRLQHQWRAAVAQHHFRHLLPDRDPRHRHRLGARHRPDRRGRGAAGGRAARGRALRRAVGHPRQHDPGGGRRHRHRGVARDGQAQGSSARGDGRGGDMRESGISKEEDR